MNWLFAQARCAPPDSREGSSANRDSFSPTSPSLENKLLGLPLPVKYEELQREIMMSLKADHFEGGRFDFNKQLNQKFFLSQDSP